MFAINELPSGGKRSWYVLSGFTASRFVFCVVFRTRAIYSLFFVLTLQEIFRTALSTKLYSCK